MVSVSRGSSLALSYYLTYAQRAFINVLISSVVKMPFLKVAPRVLKSFHLRSPITWKSTSVLNFTPFFCFASFLPSTLSLRLALSEDFGSLLFANFDYLVRSRQRSLTSSLSLCHLAGSETDFLQASLYKLCSSSNLSLLKVVLKFCPINFSRSTIAVLVAAKS